MFSEELKRDEDNQKQTWMETSTNIVLKDPFRTLNTQIADKKNYSRVKTIYMQESHQLDKVHLA